MALTGLPESTVRRWYGTFRQHLIVQMDEAYFKNAALVLAKQKGTRKLAWTIIEGASPAREHVVSFLFEKVAPGSQLWADGGSIYKNIGTYWPVEHSRDIHSKFEFAHTSESEGVLGNYRTFVRRMYHHRSANLDEYVTEFCFRFSSPELFKNPKCYLSKSLKLVPSR